MPETSCEKCGRIVRVPVGIEMRCYCGNVIKY